MLPEAKYRDFVLDRIEISDVDDCWNWTATKSKRGYGYANVDGRSYRAHRLSYMIFVGEIPDGLVLDHICNNPSCVNPAHLEAKTQRANILRGTSPTASNHRKQTCKRGHPLDSTNLMQRADGNRNCLICQTERARLGRVNPWRKQPITCKCGRQIFPKGMTSHRRRCAAS